MSRGRAAGPAIVGAPRPVRARRTALALGLAVSLLVALLTVTEVLTPWEEDVVDAMMRWREARPVDPRLAVVEIDRPSLEREGRWPWRRDRAAELVEAIAAEGARVIALDMVFAEAARVDERVDLSAEDDALEAAFRAVALDGAAPDAGSEAPEAQRPRGVVLGFAFPRSAGADGADCSAPIAGAQLSRADTVPGIPVRRAADRNLPRFADAALGQGFFDQRPERGVHRHYQLVTAHCDRYYGALALVAVARFENARLVLEAHGGDLPRLRLEERGIDAGGRVVDTDERGRLWIDYAGGSGTVRSYSAHCFLPAPPGGSPAEPPNGDCEAVTAGGGGLFEDGLVFVGFTAEGLGEVFTSPFGDEMAGVEVHAQVADNLLGGHYLRDSGLERLYSLAGLLVLGPLASFLVVAPSRTIPSIAAGLAPVPLWLGLSYLAFAEGGWHLAAVPGALAGLGGFLAGASYQIGVVDSRARQLRRTFGKFLPETVVEEMLRHPEKVRLGGERRELTVLFSDIRGFTGIAEHVGPDEVARLLDDFFTPMTALVLSHGGTLDKYMGDALMAFFGAPLEQADHAERCCRTALAMRAELVRLNERLRSEDRVPEGSAGLGIGIGVNTGEMSVGNMGSEQLFDYTVIGDAVNLGSRVEGLSRRYGVEIVVSESTVAAVGDRFLFRALDRVRVKGRGAPVEVFELVAEEPAPAEARERVAAFQAALERYRRHDFTAAVGALDSLVERFGPDGPSALYLERCRALVASPPPDDWDAVETLTSK